MLGEKRQIQGKETCKRKKRKQKLRVQRVCDFLLCVISLKDEDAVNDISRRRMQGINQ